jgi:hypothetical protein
VTVRAFGPSATILRDAITVLGTTGWTRGITRDQITGEVDVLGAILIAAGLPPALVDPEGNDASLADVPVARRPAAFYAWEALDARLDADPQAWNDAPGRTIDEVLWILTSTADALAADD